MTRLDAMGTLIIIVSYNDAKNTVTTVDSILGQGRIVVWDNGSSDRTAEKLKAKFGKDVIVHAHEQNILWTPAINRAVEQYREDDDDAILISNNDIHYYPDTVETLRAAITPEVGLIAPIGAGLGGMQDFAHWYPDHAHLDPPRFAKTLPIKRAATVVGASLLIPTTVWDEVGPLDETMPLGADDHDYAIRVKEKGFHIVVQQAAYVGHRSHASFRHAKDVWAEWGGKSWEAFNKKWAGYFVNQEEAVKCQWGYAYHRGWDVGTGWLTPEERGPIWAMRRRYGT